MATVTITLRDGLKVGETLHHEAELRETTAGDVLDVGAASERLVQAPDQTWHLVSSPAQVAVEVLCRRLVRVGEFNGPFTPGILRKLSARDLLDVQRAADLMDGASVEAALRQAGEPG